MILSPGSFTIETLLRLPVILNAMVGGLGSRLRRKPSATTAQATPRRGFKAVAIVAAVAITLGAAGYAFSSADVGGSDEPQEVAVDQAPVVTPEQKSVITRVERAREEHRLQRLPKFAIDKRVSLRKFNVKELAAIAAKEKAAKVAAERARLAKQSLSFRIGTFNVLGSNHTVPGGPRSGQYPPAGARNGGAIALIRSHAVDVLGTQELKPDQLNALTGATGMAAYPGYQFGSRDTDNSILYDPDLFEFVSGSSFTIRFMNGNRPQPIVRLRHKPTGREMYFANMHASAGGGGYAVSRRNGHLTAIGVINSLKAEGIPVFLTGDMNDRAEFFCRVAPPTGLVASIGGSTSGGCSPAGALAVDWVLGTGGVSFSDYREDRSPLGRISDHHFISSVANVAPFSG